MTQQDPQSTPGPRPAIQPDGSSRAHILVIDDSKSVCRAVERMLVRGGYAVSQAHCAADALKLLHYLTPDLVISDMMLPDQSGPSIARLLRSIERLKEVPVVLISSQQAEAMRAQSSDIDIQGLIRKPFEERELNALVDQLLKAKVPRDEPGVSAAALKWLEHIPRLDRTRSLSWNLVSGASGRWTRGQEEPPPSGVVSLMLSRLGETVGLDPVRIAVIEGADRCVLVGQLAGVGAVYVSVDTPESLALIKLHVRRFLEAAAPKAEP